MFNKLTYFKLMKEAGCVTKEDCEAFHEAFLEKVAANGEGFLSNFAKGLGTAFGQEVIKGGFKVAERLIHAVTGASMKLNPRQKSFIEQLIQEDYVLKGRKPEIVISHYETLVRLAPSISLDKNAVSSFLRYSTQHEGIDPSMLRQLADLENSVKKNSEASSLFNK